MLLHPTLHLLLFFHVAPYSVDEARLSGVAESQTKFQGKMFSLVGTILQKKIWERMGSWNMSLWPDSSCLSSRSLGHLIFERPPLQLSAMSCPMSLLPLGWHTGRRFKEESHVERGQSTRGWYSRGLSSPNSETDTL